MELDEIAVPLNDDDDDLWENSPKRLEWSNEFISEENVLLLHNWEEKRRVRHLNSECSITSYFAYYIFIFSVNVKKKDEKLPFA